MPIPNFKSSSYMLLGSDDVVIFNGALPATFTLPASRGFGDKYTVKNLGTGTLTVAGFKDDRIEGSVNITVVDVKTFYDATAGNWILL